MEFFFFFNLRISSTKVWVGEHYGTFEVQIQFSYLLAYGMGELKSVGLGFLTSVRWN